MNLLIRSYLVDGLQGAFTAIIMCTLVLTVVFLYYAYRIKLIRLGAKLMSGKEVVIETGLLNGVNLEPYKDMYSATELISIMEVLLKGVSGEQLLTKKHDVSEIMKLGLKGKVIAYQPEVEDDDDEEELPSMYSLGHLGVSPIRFDVKEFELTYELRGSLAYFDMGDKPIPYHILRTQEGTVFYKLDHATLYLKDKWLL